MPSRKRTKGKERKAKKAELEAENDKILVRRIWKGWARGENEKNEKIVHCSHGLNLNVTIPDDGHPVSKFIDSLFFAKKLKNVFEMHPQLFNNETYREMAATLLVSIAVTTLLHHPPNDDNEHAWSPGTLVYDTTAEGSKCSVRHH